MAGDKLQDHLAYPPRGMDAERAAAYIGFGRTKFLEMVGDGRMPHQSTLMATHVGIGVSLMRRGMI